MTSEPIYPADAVPGRVPPPAPPEAAPHDAAPPPVEAAPPADATEPSVLESVQAAARGVTWQQVGVGAAIGIGSAAVAAALLYASRGRRA